MYFNFLLSALCFVFAISDFCFLNFKFGLALSALCFPISAFYFQLSAFCLICAP